MTENKNINFNRNYTEAEIYNMLFYLNNTFQAEAEEAEKQENFTRAKEAAKLRKHVLKMVEGIGKLKIQL